MGQGTGRNRGYLPLCSSLCYLTPVPRTKQHGRSSPCPCSLGNRRRAQLLVLRLVRDPPAGSQTYYSFSASAEAGLVPHPHRLRLNCPSGGPSHPCKYPWLRLRQPRLAGHSNRGDGTAVKSPFLPFPTDGAGTTVLCGHTPCTFPPKPGTTLTTETAASYSGHLPGLGKSGLGAVGHKHLPGLGEPPSQKFTRHGMSPTEEAMLTKRQRGLLRLQEPWAWPA